MGLIHRGGIYLASAVVAKAVPLLMVPVLARLLPPQEFATASLFIAANSVVLALVGMNMQANIASNFYSAGREAIAVIVGNVLCVAGIVAMLGFGLAACVALVTETVFSIPSPWFLPMPALAAAMLVSALNATLLRQQSRALAFAGFEIGLALASAASSLVLVAMTDLGWKGIVVGFGLAQGLVALLAAIRMARAGYLAFAPTGAGLLSVLGFSLPLVPHALAGTVLAVSDRFFIETMAGLREVALYSVGYTFGMAMSLITEAAMRAWSPWVYRLLAEGGASAEARIVRSGYLLAASFIVGSAFVAWAAESFLGALMPPAYQGSADFVAWVTLAYAIRGIYQVFFPMIVHARATSALATNAFFVVAANLVLNYLLIGRYGAIGGAYATVLAFALSALLAFIQQQRVHPMPWFGART